MWEYKEFKTEQDRENWILSNRLKYQIEVIYINNGYAVEYRKLRVINI